MTKRQDVAMRFCSACKAWLPRSSFGQGNQHTPCRECRDKLHRERKARIFEQICRRIGSANAIGMGELYEIAFQAEWSNRQNDTRRLRDMISEMIKEGVPICSNNAPTGGGYFLPGTAGELIENCRKKEKLGLVYIQQSADLRRTSLDALLGQLALELGEVNDGSENSGQNTGGDNSGQPGDATDQARNG